MSMVGGADGVSQGVFSSKKERATLRCLYTGCLCTTTTVRSRLYHLRFGSPMLRKASSVLEAFVT